MAKSTSPWLWLALGGAGLLAFWRRKDIAKGASMVFDAAKRAAFVAVIPGEAKPYADVILRVAQEQDLNPFVIVGLGMRESAWGATLRPKGAAGTGDWVLRRGTWVGSPHTQTVNDVPAGWSAPKDRDGNVLPPPYALPEDGLGWGRGLLQIDFAASLAVNWQDPYEVMRNGVGILKTKMRELGRRVPIPGVTNGALVSYGRSSGPRYGVAAGASLPDPRPLTGDALLQASVAAYNTGSGAVIRSIAAGKHPDFTTTGGDYSSWVVGKIATLTSAFTSSGGVAA